MLIAVLGRCLVADLCCYLLCHVCCMFLKSVALGKHCLSDIGVVVCVYLLAHLRVLLGRPRPAPKCVLEWRMWWGQQLALTCFAFDVLQLQHLHHAAAAAQVLQLPPLLRKRTHANCAV